MSVIERGSLKLGNFLQSARKLTSCGGGKEGMHAARDMKMKDQLTR